MSAGFEKVYKNSLVYWLLGSALIVYFFVSFDSNKFSQSQGSFVSRVVAASGFKNLKLGIDLMGGTRLVLHIDEPKLINNRLANLGRNIEKSLAKNGVNIISKSINGETLAIAVAESKDANEVISLLKKESDVEYKNQEEAFFINFSKAGRQKIVEASTERAIDVLKNRLDSLDVKGLIVSRHGAKGIVVQLPGVDDVKDIKESISRAAKLEFRAVYENGYSEDDLMDKFDGIIPSDRVMMFDDNNHAYLVSLFPEVDGSKVKDARTSLDERGKPAVSFVLDSEGARDFAQLTKDLLGGRIAVILDGKVIMAPGVNTVIKDGSGVINGLKDQKEALKLAKILRSGVMDASLILEQENRVGASLGADAVNSGFMSCLIALFILFLFSLFYYRLSGLFAMLALFFNVLLTLVLLSLLKATLTLYGVAGIVLTVGMAIDASILIFEKIKEDMSSGLINFSDAVASGFEGATAVILDANITTFLAGAVLFFYGGVAVKGFAVTLMIGIVSTVITGVFFLRSIFEFCNKVLGWNKVSI